MSPRKPTSKPNASRRRQPKPRAVGPGSPNLREAIIAAALDLLREQGARGLAQPRVAKKAGIPQGHLTYYFPRKADLLLAVAERAQTSIQAQLASLAEVVLAARRSFTEPQEGWNLERAAAAGALAGLLEDRGRTRALLGLLVEAEQDESLRASLVETLEAGRPFLAALLGCPVDHVDVDLVRALAWGLEVQELVIRRPPEAAQLLMARVLEWLARAVASREARDGDPNPETH